MLRFCSRFLRTLFQFSKHAAGEATKFGRSGVEFLGVVGVACLECDEPAAEAGELIGRQLGDNFGDFFDFHVAQYSTAGAWLSRGRINLRPPMSASGQSRHFRRVMPMSALPPKADIARRRKMASLRYSITTSASESSFAETSRPSALAVFILISSSNLVGACTGRSAGLAPLRTRSMYPAPSRKDSIQTEL